MTERFSTKNWCCLPCSQLWPAWPPCPSASPPPVQAVTSTRRRHRDSLRRVFGPGIRIPGSRYRLLHGRPAGRLFHLCSHHLCHQGPGGIFGKPCLPQFKGQRDKSICRRSRCGVIDIVLVAGGYCMCEVFLYGLGAALASVPSNIIQGISGLIISSALYPVLQKPLSMALKA